MSCQQSLRSITAAIIVFLAMMDRASGAFFDGNDLYAKCTSFASFDRAQCIGYVMGILDAGGTEAAFAWVQQGAKGPMKRPNEETLGGFRWCPRETVTAGQAVDVVIKFLRDNPSIRDAGAAPGLVAMAMQQAWSCGP